MSFSNLLRAARESPASAFHGYLLRKKENGIHIFLEGAGDESFYICRVRSVIPIGTALTVFRCGTKKAVYETRQKIAGYPKPTGRNLFFVDKDLDDLLGTAFPAADDIFVTCCYSIENYFVTTDVLKIICEEIFHLSDQQKIIDHACARFSNSLHEFHSKMTLIMGWIIATKTSGARPNLNNVDLSKIFKLDEELKINSVYGEDALLAELERMCGIPPGASIKAQVIEWAHKLQQLPPKIFVRGKYEIWFLCKFIASLRTTVLASFAGTKKPSIRTDITHGNAIEILAPRIPIPADLNTFLTRNLSISGAGSQLWL